MNLNYEKNLYKQGYKLAIGLDEVGRGAWAGPIVAGCVYIPTNLILTNQEQKLFNQIKDSKKLNAAKRAELYDFIITNFLYSTSQINSQRIDKIGIGEANKLVLRQAVKNFSQKYQLKPDYLLVDYFFDLGFSFSENNQITIQGIKFGDNKVLSIAAASIVAKVYRDNLMLKLAKKYPKYHFDKHKGYGTKLHRYHLVRNGVCIVHRLSYKPVQKINS